MAPAARAEAGAEDFPLTTKMIVEVPTAHITEVADAVDEAINRLAA